MSIASKRLKKNKAALKDKVVKIEILKLVWRAERFAWGMALSVLSRKTLQTAPRLTAKSRFHAKVWRKWERTRGPITFTIYARVHVFTQQKDAAAISVASALKIVNEGGKATYSW